MSSKIRLEGEALAAFEAEIEALRREQYADVGARDARHIRRVRGVVQGTAISGRGLLMFGVGPLSWIAGVIYDHFGFYAPAFATGLAFNLINLSILSWLLLRWMRPQRAATLS